MSALHVCMRVCTQTHTVQEFTEAAHLLRHISARHRMTERIFFATIILGYFFLAIRELFVSDLYLFLGALSGRVLVCCGARPVGLGGG